MHAYAHVANSAQQQAYNQHRSISNKQSAAARWRKTSAAWRIKNARSAQANGVAYGSVNSAAACIARKASGIWAAAISGYRQAWRSKRSVSNGENIKTASRR